MADQHPTTDHRDALLPKGMVIRVDPFVHEGAVRIEDLVVAYNLYSRQIDQIPVVDMGVKANVGVENSRHSSGVVLFHCLEVLLDHYEKPTKTYFVDG